MENQTNWFLDPTHSEILFKVKHLMITNVKGEFRNFSASIRSEGNDFSKSEVQANIEAASIFTNNTDRDAHLQNADFFDVSAHKELNIMKTVIHKADSRGDANHGWLHSKHTFSFANYFEPARTHFGVLRVLNDDSVDAGMGFGTHHHDNMEIISIPLEGDLEHQDSMGNKTVIKSGDIQIMSAGSGISHSEYNKNPDKPVKFLQIWVIPNKRNAEPRYDQITLNIEDRHNKFQQILSPNPEDEGVWIHQNAWFHLGKFDKGFSTEYTIKGSGNGVYAFILSGDVSINDQKLNARDGYGIREIDNFKISADTDAEILLMEVPMN